MSWRPRILERRFWAFMQGPLSVRRAMGAIVTATVITVIAGGVLIRIVDPASFPDIGAGLWGSLQTVTTGGYGDLTPHEPLGRVVGAVIMLESIAFIAIVTAAITSNFVERARRQAGGSDPVLVAAELREIRSRLEQIQERLDDLDDRR